MCISQWGDYAYALTAMEQSPPWQAVASGQPLTEERNSCAEDISQHIWTVYISIPIEVVASNRRTNASFWLLWFWLSATLDEGSGEVAQWWSEALESQGGTPPCWPLPPPPRLGGQAACHHRTSRNSRLTVAKRQHMPTWFERKPDKTVGLQERKAHTQNANFWCLFFGFHQLCSIVGVGFDWDSPHMGRNNFAWSWFVAFIDNDSMLIIGCAHELWIQQQGTRSTKCSACTNVCPPTYFLPIQIAFQLSLSITTFPLVWHRSPKERSQN